MLSRLLFFCVLLSSNLSVQAQNRAISTSKPLIDTSVHEKGLFNGRFSTGLEEKATEAKKFREDSKAFIESLGVKDLGKKIIKTAKKKLQPRDEYAGIKTEGRLGNYGSGVRMTAEQINVVKYVEDEALSPYLQDIFIFDPAQSRVISIQLKEAKNAQICHGPYKKFVNQKLVEEGYFHMGVKDGRWENYGPENELENKAYYVKGFLKESTFQYYDASRKKIKEVIPRNFGKVRGTYQAFYANGNLKETGKLDDSVRVGIWREYHEVGNGGRLKKEWKYGADKFDAVEPKLIQERDQQSKIIFQTKEALSQHKSENIPPLNSDDEDLVDEDSTENSDFVHHLHPYAFSYSSIRLLIPGEDADLTSGYLIIHLTPPDFTV
jgi:antitoxin component YwqK of YwqJK toxin-antitoxin module